MADTAIHAEAGGGAIALACDHGGFALKRDVIRFLDESGLPYRDFGCDAAESCDYAPFAFKAARAVAAGGCPRGIVICGTGAGISLACNKVKGIRCVLCADPLTARLAKQHNDANMIALGGRIIGAEMAKEIVRAWLGACFEGGRHLRRVEQITRIENGDFCGAC